MAERTDYKFSRMPNKEYLLNHSFRYLRDFSDDEVKAYGYRFPVYRYGSDTLIEAEFMTFIPTNVLWVNVYVGRNSRDLYAPYYYYEYGDFTPILTIIQKKIDAELYKLGIERKEDEVNRRRSELSKVPKRKSKRKPKVEDSD